MAPHYVVMLKNKFIEPSIKCASPSCKIHASKDWEVTRPTRLSVHEAVSILLKEKVSTGPWKARQGGKEKQGHQSCSVFFTVPLTLGPPSVGKSGQRSRVQYSSRERGPGHDYATLPGIPKKCSHQGPNPFSVVLSLLQ